MGATLVTTNGLCQEMAVTQVVVFPLASGAKRKIGQRRLGTLVRQGLRDGIARTTMGATDERIVHAMGLRHAIAQTIGTNRDVRWNLRLLIRCLIVGQQGESIEIILVQVRAFVRELCDMCGKGMFSAYAIDKKVSLLGRCGNE